MLLVDIWLLLAVNPPSIFFMIDGRSQMGAEAKHGLGDTRSLGKPVYKPRILDTQMHRFLMGIYLVGSQQSRL